MRLCVVLVIISLFMTTQVLAQPYVVCDDADVTNVTYYVIDLDGTEYTTPYPLHLDLVGISSGQHMLIGKAGNAWGESDWSDPFMFSANAPGVPSGFGLSAQ